MSNTADASIIALGFDLFSIKLYWVASSAVWVYDYLLTFGDEVEYAWKGKKTFVFWLFFLNRYLIPCIIVINLFAYFSDAWTVDICNRSGFMEALQTILLTSTAEIFLTLRVYAITNRNKFFPYLAAMILATQWGAVLYGMARSSLGKDEPALLLSPPVTPLPTLPDIDPYHICVFIFALEAIYLVEILLFLSLAFDALVFLIVMVVTFRSSRTFHFMPLMRVIQRDGVVYFFVLFSSNLIWVLLFLHARPGLKFMHNQPSAVISAIMVNRITLNLKAACASQDHNASWSIKTFEQPPVYINVRRPSTSVIELGPVRSGNISRGIGRKL